MANAGNNNALSTLQNFLANNLQVTVSSDDCAICREPYDPNHLPAQVQAPNCSHIFGGACLRLWFARSPTCPMCRATLFDEPRLPQETEDLSIADFLRSLSIPTSDTIGEPSESTPGPRLAQDGSENDDTNIGRALNLFNNFYDGSYRTYEEDAEMMEAEREAMMTLIAALEDDTADEQ